MTYLANIYLSRRSIIYMLRTRRKLLHNTVLKKLIEKDHAQNDFILEALMKLMMQKKFNSKC